MKKVVLSIIVIVVFWGMGVKLVKAACQGTCTTCDSIYHHYACTNGETCTGPGDLGCSDGSTCVYKYDVCNGEDTCSCDSIIGECGCTGGCKPGQVAWSNTCCTPNWPNPLCTSDCGVAGYSVYDGCGNSHWCPATPACCSESDPDAPALVSPVNGTIVNTGSAVNLDWNAISDWGEGCPNTNKYSVCVSSNQISCDYVWADTNTSTTNYSWTPSVGDSYVTWLIQSNNDSRTKNSETRNFCVEGEFCSLQCGQLRNCSGNCTGEDSGAPGAPTVLSPLGSALNPVILFDTTPLLDWEGNDALTDSYEITVINPSGGVVWTGTTTAGTTNISVGTALSNNITYRWYVRALNSTCSPYGQNSYSSPSGYGYFRINSPPVIGNFYIFNVGNAEVVAEAGSRNHICQSDFNGSRFVNFRLNVSDADGVNDISQVTLNWNDVTYTLNRGATWPTGATYTTTIDYGTYHDQGIYEIRARAIDNLGTTIDQGTGRNWKVWNCQVPVNGNLYDGSADHSCTGGFNTLADLTMDFRDLIFDNITESVAATVTVPNSFVVDMGNLVWNRSYLPLINRGDNFNPNGGLAATGRLTRMTDLGTGVLTCPVSDQFALNVSPYSANPSAKIDFSFIRDQESWYQVRGGGVRAGNSIESGVPVTANALERYLTLGRNLMTTIDNGVVSYANNFSNTNGYNDEAYGSPHSWWKNSSLLPATRYGYQYFYNNLYVKAGVGVTGDTWDEKPSEGVFFVNGNLNIDSDFTLAADKFLMVVVSGNITISNTVNRIDGIYVSDGELSATGNSANPLVINGMIFSRSSVVLARSFNDKTLNNTAPATVVNYQPGLLFNMPVKISKVISGWRVIVNAANSHFMPDVFTDPQRFDPLRWSPERDEGKNPFSIVGFGGGMHKCTRMNFARNEMTVITALLLQQFDLELRSPEIHVVYGNGANHPPPIRVAYRRKAAA